MNLEDKRDDFVDVAKGIAMILVIQIHTEVFGVINAPYPTIAVPLFFFLSGFYDNTGISLKEWLPKSFKRLFVVGLFWVLISFVYLSMLSYAKDRTISVAFSLEKPLIAGYETWFLFALFYAKCGAWLIHQCKLPSVIMLSFLLLFGGVISMVNLPLLLDEGFGAIPFYLAGKLFYSTICNNTNMLKRIAFVGIPCMFLMGCKWFPRVFVPYHNNIFLYPLFFIMLVCTFSSVLWISKIMESQQWLVKYGRQTLGILVIHPLLLHTCAIGLNRLYEVGSTLWIIIFLCTYIIVCVASYYCTILISKYTPFLVGQKRKKM